MGALTRRLFLRNTAAGAAATVAFPALAESPPALEPIVWPEDRVNPWERPQISPRARLDAAIDELKAAAEAIWPNANDWMVKIDALPTMPLLINAYDPKMDNKGAMKATRSVVLKSSRA